MNNTANTNNEAEDSSSHIRRAQTTLKDPNMAAEQLSKDLHLDNMAGVIFFCSDEYDPDALSEALKAHFDCLVVGCTSAGEIGSCYQEGGIVGMSFSSEQFCLHPVPIYDLSSFEQSITGELAQKLQGELKFSNEINPDDMFGLFLIDGLSVREEPVIAALHASMPSISIAGGSAGDNLKFNETRVYDGQNFHSDSAIFVLVESKLPFHAFKLQHFVPSGDDMVITHADPHTRTVYEVDGGPAAEEYASILGLKTENLTSQYFSQHPVMLQIGTEWYVRSIQKMNDDGSLTFFCAIDEGLPLTLAKGVDIVETLKTKVDEIKNSFSSISCTLGFDCILRRLELQEAGKVEDIEKLLNEINFVGFSTFGEQYGSIHVNQTLTGVVIGER